ncbi:MAG: cell division protein FtsQ/DivIB [Chloroflexota bacterium]
MPHRTWWSIVALVICMTLLAASLGGFFRVRSVKVVGASLPSDAVALTAGVVGQNIFTVRSDQVVRRLASMHELDVQRVDAVFPNGVTVYVRMRRRFLAWRDGKALYEVDPQGRIIAQVQTTHLPVIDGTQPGQTLPPGIVQAVRYAAETLPSAPRGDIATFHMDPKVGLVVVGRAGWQAAVGRGTPQTLVDRIAELSSVLGDPQVRQHGLRFVDLRLPTPFLRLAGV